MSSLLSMLPAPCILRWGLHTGRHPSVFERVFCTLVLVVTPAVMYDMLGFDASCCNMSSMLGRVFGRGLGGGSVKGHACEMIG